MPSDKPRVQAIMKDRYYKKLNILAKKGEYRSISEIAREILEDYIDQYEKENGCILIEETTPEPEDQKARMLAYNKKILETAAQVCRKEE